MHGKLERVLRDFAWDRMDRVFAELVMKQGVEKNNDELPLPLREGAGGRGATTPASWQFALLPPAPSLKGRGSSCSFSFSSYLFPASHPAPSA